MARRKRHTIKSLRAAVTKRVLHPGRKGLAVPGSLTPLQVQLLRIKTAVCFWQHRPRLTFVVATYNVAPYLDAFFESVFAQTDGLDGLEVIVVNDGATDESGQIAQAWAARYPRTLRVIMQDNQGVSAARNAGLAQATGDWVSFPDPDDFLSPDYLMRVRAEIRRGKSRKLLAVAVRQILYHEATDSYSNSHPLQARFTNKVQHYESTDMGDVLLAHTNSTFICRADIAAQNLTFDTTVTPSFEDAHFVIRLLMHCPGRTVSFLPRPTYYYRKRQAENSLVDGIERKPGWYASHLQTAYLALLEEARMLRGNVPQFVQNNVLFSLLAKLRYLTGPNYDPSLLDPAAKHQFLLRLSEVMNYVDTDTLHRARLPGFYPIHRLALVALYKDDAQPKPHIVLQEPVSDMSGFCLRWVIGGDAIIEVIVQVDGVTLEDAGRRRTQRMLFDQVYGQIFYQPVVLKPGQNIRVFVEQSPVPIIYKGQSLGLQVSYDQLTCAVAIQ